MRRAAPLFLVLLALLPGACASRRSAARPAPNPRYYEAYYDGYYGPFIDGYWGRNERFFWYLDAGKAWRRDDKHHFQRGDGGPSWQWVRGTGAPRTNP
jgi:hypothetical protein